MDILLAAYQRLSHLMFFSFALVMLRFAVDDRLSDGDCIDDSSVFDTVDEAFAFIEAYPLDVHHVVHIVWPF